MLWVAWGLILIIGLFESRCRRFSATICLLLLRFRAIRILLLVARFSAIGCWIVVLLLMMKIVGLLVLLMIVICGISIVLVTVVHLTVMCMPRLGW